MSDALSKFLQNIGSVSGFLEQDVRHVIHCSHF